MGEDQSLKDLFEQAISKSSLDVDSKIDSGLERPKDNSNGDFVFAYGITCAMFISVAVILWIYICRSKSIKLKGM